MKKLTMNQNRMGAYLTAGLGAGCLAGNAEATTVVTIYGQNATSPTGIDVRTEVSTELPGMDRTNGYAGIYAGGAHFRWSGYEYFTNGIDLNGPFAGTLGQYLSNGSFTRGGSFGNANYASISFNGEDGVFEAVGQFRFDGTGGGYLIAIAQNDDNSALSISAGKAEIDAVPEPASLALLALGAAGLLARRRRVAAS